MLPSIGIAIYGTCRKCGDSREFDNTLPEYKSPKGRKIVPTVGSPGAATRVYEVL